MSSVNTGKIEINSNIPDFHFEIDLVPQSSYITVENRINEIIDNIKHLVETKKFQEAISYLERNPQGFLLKFSLIKFLLHRYHLLELIKNNDLNIFKYYEENISDYLKQLSESFKGNLFKYEDLINYSYLINWDWLTTKIKEDLHNFLRILYNKLRLFLSESYQDFSFYPNCVEEYDFDLENSILIQIKKYKNQNHYENVHELNNNFIEIQGKYEHIKLSNFLNYKVDKTFSLIKKENDMELDENRTDVSNDHLINTINQPKKFAIIKTELCLKKSPPNEKMKCKIPFLRDFHMKFTKRENIDKKIIRKFRKFLKQFIQRTGINTRNIQDGDFWKAFMDEELYPPFKYRCLDQNRIYEYKSFNTNYMSWVFSNQDADFFYNEFLKEKGEEVYKSILSKNKRILDSYSDYERSLISEQLKNYIINLAFIFNTKKIEENSEFMPAVSPNNQGDFYDEMLELDVNAFYNEESFYNKKK